MYPVVIKIIATPFEKHSLHSVFFFFSEQRMQRQMSYLKVMFLLLFWTELLFIATISMMSGLTVHETFFQILELQ